ncbi:PPC domain-containing DNA-binding protein [Neolewinella antarctica]|uniref:PPC domain-containing protein n=1 Tax=Neolewinella antarctica TaxID=442734 RepID=A0ABX0XEU7_9BACT|nr:PPC domain-containing DNA-binding protein [Neolewinella antarctica]NJC27766.1 hypothetical protein [Neolewinella antarctica]
MHRFPLLILLMLALSNCTPTPAPMKIHALRLLPGQDLKQEIQAYVERNGIEAGFVQTCVGSLTDWHLRFANAPAGTTGTGHFEIVSLVGLVSTHGTHLHVSVSDSLGRVTGGHLLDGNVVYTTAEIVIGESLDHVFQRANDGSTPYKELRVDPR